MPGAFVVFEGGDGAGKSTQCRLLADALRARGHEVVVTREPGGTATGEAIREVLLGAGSDGMAARTEALLFAAARAEHAAALIRPAVARGAVVISDRYLDSSVAYQGAARGLGEDRIAELSQWATEDLVPDLTVLLDVAPGVGLSRAGDANRMEAEPEAFHAEVRESFLRRAAAAPERYLVLEADRSRDEVAEVVLAAVVDRLATADLPPSPVPPSPPISPSPPVSTAPRSAPPTSPLQSPPSAAPAPPARPAPPAPPPNGHPLGGISGIGRNLHEVAENP